MASTKMNNSMAAGQQRSGTQLRFAAAAMAVMAAILLAAQLLLRLNGGHQVGQGYGGTSAGIVVLSFIRFLGLSQERRYGCLVSGRVHQHVGSSIK